MGKLIKLNFSINTYNKTSSVSFKLILLLHSELTNKAYKIYLLVLYQLFSIYKLPSVCLDVTVSLVIVYFCIIGPNLQRNAINPKVNIFSY